MQALTATARANGCDARILNAGEVVNPDQKAVLIHCLMNYYGGSIAGKAFAMWGLSFNPETNDAREEPSVFLIQYLPEAGARVCACNPTAPYETRPYPGDLENLPYVEYS